MNTLNGYSKSTLSDLFTLTASGGHFPIHEGRNNEKNKLVRTDASGYILAGWINTLSGDMGTTAATRIYCSNDAYIRYKTLANFSSDIAGQLYWANVKVSTSSNVATIPTLGKLYISGAFPHIDMTSTSAESSIYFRPSSGTSWAIGKSPWGVDGFGIGILKDGSKFTILDNGNIGIGTINPSYKLDVNGNISCSNLVLSYGGKISNSGLYGLYINGNAGDYGPAIYLTHDHGQNLTAFRVHSHYDHGIGGLSIGFSTTTQNYGTSPIDATYSEIIHIRGNSNIGIGTVFPLYKLHIVGDIYSTIGFKKDGSSNDYVLLGGGGHKLISDFASLNHDHNRIKGPDARSSNNTPLWYMSNRGSGSVTSEFSSQGTSILGRGYTNLTTFTPWGDSSGDYPVLLAFNLTGMAMRTAASVNAWNGWPSGNIYAGNFYTASDIRYKKILSNIKVSVKQLAKIPLFNFTWTDVNDNMMHSGTSALKVKKFLPYIVTGSDKLTLDYATLGTIAGITACKELVAQKSEIELLKDRIELLEQQLKMYHGNSK